MRQGVGIEVYDRGRVPTELVARSRRPPPNRLESYGRQSHGGFTQVAAFRELGGVHRAAVKAVWATPASALIDGPWPEAIADRSRRSKVEYRWVGGPGNQINRKPIQHAFLGDGGETKASVRLRHIFARANRSWPVSAGRHGAIGWASAQFTPRSVSAAHSERGPSRGPVRSWSGTSYPGRWA